MVKIYPVSFKSVLVNSSLSICGENTFLMSVILIFYCMFYSTFMFSFFMLSSIGLSFLFSNLILSPFVILLLHPCSHLHFYVVSFIFCLLQNSTAPTFSIPKTVPPFGGMGMAWWLDGIDMVAT